MVEAKESSDQGAVQTLAIQEVEKYLESEKENKETSHGIEKRNAPEESLDDAPDVWIAGVVDVKVG